MEVVLGITNTLVPELKVLVDHFASECLEVIGTDMERDAGSLVQIGGTNLRKICKKDDE